MASSGLSELFGTAMPISMNERIEGVPPSVTTGRGIRPTSLRAMPFSVR